jgi:hypothetical protein
MYAAQAGVANKLASPCGCPSDRDARLGRGRRTQNALGISGAVQAERDVVLGQRTKARAPSSATAESGSPGAAAGRDAASEDPARLCRRAARPDRGRPVALVIVSAAGRCPLGKIIVGRGEVPIRPVGKFPCPFCTLTSQPPVPADRLPGRLTPGGCGPEGSPEGCPHPISSPPRS